MTIAIHHEPMGHCKSWGIGDVAEHCVFCNKQTRYWSADKHNPVCPECAKVHDEEELKCPT